MSNSSNNRSITTAWSAIAIAFALLALIPSSAAAQYCAQYKKELLDTSNNCVSEPFRDRAMAVDTFRWNGNDYMIFNVGNELAVYGVSNPTNPQGQASSNFIKRIT